MAQQEQISELISDKVFTDLAKLTEELAKSEQQLIDNTIAATRFNEVLANSQGSGPITTASQRAQQAIDRVALAQGRLQVQADRLQQAQQRVALSQNRVTTSTGQQELAFNRLRAAAENDNREFSLLTARLRELDRAAQDAGARFGTSSTQFIAARDAANAVRTEVNGIQNGLGNYTNQVGQYSQGIAGYFRTAFSGIRTLANILPNFGIGTAFLLIGRAILYVVDQSDILKNAFTQLAFKLGIIDSLTAKYTSTAKILSDVNLKGAQDAESELVSLNELYKASQNRNLALSERKKAVDEIQKQYPDYFKNIKDETILAGGAKSQYDLLAASILATAKARASEELIAENSKRQLLNEQAIVESKAKQVLLQKDLNEVSKYNNAGGSTSSTGANALGNASAIGQTLAVQQKINAEIKTQNNLKTDSNVLTQRNLALEKNIDDLVQKNGVKVLLPDKDLENKPKKAKDTRKTSLDEQLKIEKDNEDAILNNVKSSYDERLTAVDNFEKNSLALISGAEAKKVITSQNAILRLKNIENDASSDRQKIAAAELAALEKTYKAQIDQAQARDKIILENLKETSEARLSQIEKDKNKELTALIDRYTSGKINEKEYQKQVVEVEQNALKERTDEQIKYYQGIIDLKKAAGQDASADQIALDKIEADRDKNLYDLKKKNLEDYAKAVKQLHDLEKSLASELFDFGKELGDNTFTIRLNNIQKEKDAITDSTAVQIDAENRSIDSAQVKADKIAVINAQAKAKQDQLDAETRRVKHDQAEFDKLADLAKAASGIAVAEIQALTYLSNPFTAPLYPEIAAFIGAVGAIQLAAIAARQIPAYEKGTKSSKAGLALVGEKGVERVTEPDGNVWYTPEKPTLVSLVGGSKITNNKELMQEMARPPQFGNIMASLDLNGVITSQKQVGKDIVKAIQSQRTGSTRTGVIHRNTKYYKGYLNG